MVSPKHLRGARDLLFEGVEVVTNLVERTHTEVADRWTERVALLGPVAPLARAVNALQRAGAATTYASIRLVSRGAAALARVATDPLLEGETSAPVPWWVEQAEGAINGLYGDHLALRQNGLDLGMTLRHGGTPLRLERDELARVYPRASPRVCVFVHGLSTTEASWSFYAQALWGEPAVCFGSRLEAELGFTPLFVRYNTGRHISDSGQALSALLTRIHEAYPVPIEQLALVGHSMGGLVCRSTAHHGALVSAPWVPQLRHVFCIGSPHLGAPLEQGVNVLASLLRRIPAAAATVPAAVLDGRSAGIRDLRHGYTVEAEWAGEDPTAARHDNRHDLAPVEGVTYCAVAATITNDPEHPAGQLLGDLLVRLPSGSGLASTPERHIPFHSRLVVPGMTHLHLANHPAVYAMLAGALGDAP